MYLHSLHMPQTQMAQVEYILIAPPEVSNLPIELL